jgi:hypothetical protein
VSVKVVACTCLTAKIEFRHLLGRMTCHLNRLSLTRQVNANPILSHVTSENVVFEQTLGSFGVTDQ